MLYVVPLSRIDVIRVSIETVVLEMLLAVVGVADKERAMMMNVATN